MHAVIMAGGKGTRLRPFSIVLPKPLMPIGEQPILQILLKRLKAHGVTEVTLAVNHFAELIQAFFQDGAKLGMSVTYSTEEKPLSTIGPLKLMEADLPETFLVMNGDLLTDIDFVDFLNFHHSHEAEVTVAVYSRKVHVDYGVMHLDSEGRLSGFEEKPTHEVKVSMGVYALNRALETRRGFPARLDPASEFYRGRPLAMTGNDYELELYNGDVGVVMEEPRASGRGGRAVFSSPEGEPRWVSTQRLGSAETVFAMSIHKSQGSEFTEVMVVLPTEDSLFLTRELIYTAVSRARERVTLVARREVLKRAITRRVERSSGLSDALWGAGDRGDHVSG